ncbi:hypothetical protein B0H66DRAFT_237725 [Apodospora peruviana]|uniref:G-patch domain-containing protein n=1 Tax=Apodospora peruviana TaxID=516989 RepID=A0AAE0M4I0_9PEZI|nr:hypothetical protein B0H66DRAFT_237725 [Apodospora peruviana]
MATPPGADDDDYNEVPLQHKRPFGSGLHRKAIAFVPATGDTKSLTAVPAAEAKRPQQSVSDLYRSMVLPHDNIKTHSSLGAPDERIMCEICKLPLDSLAAEHPTARRHETSLAHQLCLPHSHPPSAIDRSRMGLSYLSAHGWDPDARKGLGAAQQGIQFPVKTKPKDDKLGIGLQLPKNLPAPKPKAKLLDAGKVRKLVKEEKRKAERIRQQLYGGKDLEKYLGLGAVR